MLLIVNDECYDICMQLNETFDQAAATYQHIRPTYPAALFAKLIADTQLKPSAALLEIGPGTGQATLPLAKAGYDITAIELGAHLAAKARETLRKFPNVKIVNAAFEDVDLPEEAFDLVYSATAFHWIKPEAKFAKPHTLLKDGGYLAIIHTEHVSDESGNTFFAASQPIYKKYEAKDRPNHIYDFAPPKLEALQPPEKVDQTRFTLESFTVFPMTVRYSSQEFADLLSTFSPNLAMPEKKRRAFLHEIKTLIDEKFGGYHEKHYGMTLTILRKKSN